MAFNKLLGPLAQRYRNLRRQQCGLLTQRLSPQDLSGARECTEQALPLLRLASNGNVAAQQAFGPVHRGQLSLVALLLEQLNRHQHQQPIPQQHRQHTGALQPSPDRDLFNTRAHSGLSPAGATEIGNGLKPSGGQPAAQDLRLPGTGRQLLFDLQLQHRPLRVRACRES